MFGTVVNKSLFGLTKGVKSLKENKDPTGFRPQNGFLGLASCFTWAVEKEAVVDVGSGISRLGEDFKGVWEPVEKPALGFPRVLSSRLSTALRVAFTDQRLSSRSNLPAKVGRNGSKPSHPGAHGSLPCSRPMCYGTGSFRFDAGCPRSTADGPFVSNSPLRALRYSGHSRAECNESIHSIRMR